MAFRWVRKIRILQKLEIHDLLGILKIDEDADFLAGFRFEGGFQQPGETERRKTRAETCSEIVMAEIL
jgi:hypothetical protein